MRKETLKSIAERSGISLVYLFGSRADEGKRYLEGEEIATNSYSDLDIAVAFERFPVETVQVYGKLYREISDLFDPFRIDLIFIHEMNSLFQYEIIKGEKIYERSVTFADDFEEGVMKRAGDLIYKKRIFDRDVLEAMEHGYFEFEYVPNP